jgi:hypothetical protein
MNMQYEEYLEELVSQLPEPRVAALELDPIYRDYCLEQARKYPQHQSEIYDFLAVCGWISTHLFTHAFQTSQESDRPRALLSKDLVLAMEVWQRGILVNLGIQLLRDAYQTIMRWWKRVCKALTGMTHLRLEQESGSAIALAADLTLARYAV